MVRITAVIPVEITSEEPLTEDSVRFMIEENSDPATGAVGNALERIVEEHDERHTCWACTYDGKNEIVSLEIDQLSGGESKSGSGS